MRLMQVILIALRIQLTTLCINYVIFHGSFAMDPPPACHSPGVSPLETTFPSLLWPERVHVGFKIRLSIEVYGGFLMVVLLELTNITNIALYSQSSLYSSNTTIRNPALS